EFSYNDLRSLYPDNVPELREEISRQIELQLKYAGYIQRQNTEIARLEGVENFLLPESLNYLEVNGLSREAKEKLHKIRPVSIGQASRISGISPADISLLMITLRGKKKAII
ncbi:MAG: tRNA uridine-5-carboxymethylaminomethyl(34) synthesis enzyme MnmG, partial [Verrucomicrobia bacterium]|nr:tRNA uridine-5-carboxymethylaminomethyl(34) synthesis enzyme MnmG [Verrucomicrobiota bacterium]